MHWPPDPKSWSEFPQECFWYLIPGVVWHILALIISVIGIGALRMLTSYRPRFSTVFLFQGYLLAAAMLMNGAWSSLVWGRFYWSIDYTSDFSAFMPIIRNQIEGSWGPIYSSGLKDISLTQLNLIWLIFALGAWLLALVTTRWTCNRLLLPVQENRKS
jgi:hypothetical protein